MMQGKTSIPSTVSVSSWTTRRISSTRPTQDFWSRRYITNYSYSGRQLDTHYQKIMFSKNHSCNNTGTHCHLKKNLVNAGTVLGKGFVQVAVNSRIVAGTVFEEIF
jgi:hypothetical protein